MEQVLVLFLLIVAGIIIKKRGIVTEHINKEVSSLVINVCLPAFILSSMAFDFSVEVLINSGMLVFLSFTIYGVSIVLAKLLNRALKIKGAARDVYEYIAVFQTVVLWAIQSCMRPLVKKLSFMRLYIIFPFLSSFGLMGSSSCSGPIGKML